MAGDAHERVALDRGVLIAVAKQLDRGAQQREAEAQEHDRERVQQRGAREITLHRPEMIPSSQALPAYPRWVRQS